MLRIIARHWLAMTLALATFIGSAGCDDGLASPAPCDGRACDQGDPACDEVGRAAGCSDAPSPTSPDEGAGLVRYADVVVDAPGHTGDGFFDSAAAVNGVRGRGAGQGGFDVFSLGYDADDHYLVLRWSGAIVANGPGADFAVFENSFQLSQPGQHFMDLVVVELSRDGQTWVAFPHDYVAADESSYSKRAEDWVGFAGRTPVLFHEDDNPVDPFDPDSAGGDHFDLDDLPDDGGESSQIRQHGFRFIRLSSAPALENPDTGAPFVRDSISDGGDIDGVYGRYVVEETAL